ncbi:MAG: hypothetical protein B0D96_07365 [Candidatus Sedimenticola endophacoides]|uniref:DedA family protein n=1 Tax=Candidatus Sedimenticola endophacoides TaxID=2548426 RepID=A0A6N4E1J3_9GAMM|nr:MAG: hypothetical protein B0D94_02325 [Candidatus Sedimenticola endophacoides]OQX35215.1 MAG: hypothetical protein B0D96_07365 [Candidatus Sedimenticola endophacoides]OQX41215.1 MAG: hypothetical protein B0D89_04900 [Candidatus Sedimenticola endophacoides]OQX42474.1 MAG: hypothetical protein B0D88_06570 [Candidatus Sedimenticola endophacoides]PUD99677.1 MAG: DedA family protein [Candidatus Sedimenticola endophacoides]
MSGSALALWGLFTSSLLASTLLPGGSEAVLAYTAAQQSAPPLLLWLAATLGNTLGGLTSWGIGWWLLRRFPGRGLQRPGHRRALERIRRHGSPLLLLSWLPVVGDPLCLAAGWSGIRLLPALLFIALGKGVRYALLLAVVPTTA